jgi:hypothetical protein
MSESQGGDNREPLDSSAGALEIAARAARDGAADAREAATRVWSATSLFVSRFVYTTCYTVSYGVVFPTMLLAHSIPKNNAAVRGLVDGAEAAIQKVDRVRGSSRELQVNTALPALAPT